MKPRFPGGLVVGTVVVATACAAWLASQPANALDTNAAALAEWFTLRRC